MRISDWSSDVCSSDLHDGPPLRRTPGRMSKVSRRTGSGSGDPTERLQSWTAALATALLHGLLVLLVMLAPPITVPPPQEGGAAGSPPQVTYNDEPLRPPSPPPRPPPPPDPPRTRPP